MKQKLNKIHRKTKKQKKKETHFRSRRKSIEKFEKKKKPESHTILNLIS